jgi:cellulose synthase/poly-beta-1,6-N-acetylglucosamine synthase-like glycosyltransferase
MLASLLLGAVIVGPLATIGLFLPVPNRFGSGALMWTRRLVLALIGTAVLAAAGGYGVYVLNDSRRYAIAVVAMLVAASAIWLPATRRWNARAHLCWAMNFCLFAVYLVFMLDWTFQTPLGAAGRIGALLLWLLELFAALLGAAYLWELCDALGREHWMRRSRAGVSPQSEPDAPHPFVSLHVPSYEEPPDMVIETLSALRRIDYDNYEIIAIDDNTVDESLWRPVEAWCAANGVKFVHLADWPGYKSGALNYALNEMTDPRAEVIGVIDSDYQIEPDFLLRCAPLFNDPEVGFIQSPQDYRDWEGSSYFRRLYYSYKYFFAVSQPSRNERDGAIFAGTMGLIRRAALDGVGGWDEWCITEDAELSLRLLRAGWSGTHVDESFGHGVMPLSFEALKGQRFRWCFGGIQILRMHWRSMLPGSRTRGNQMSLGQRWAYLSGAVQWYGDLVGVVFFFFLLGGAVNIALGGGLLFRKLSAFLVAAIPLLVVLGFVRAVALIRRGTGASWSDALGAFMIWQSTALVVARASIQGLFAKRAEFLRTPKTSEEGSFWSAVWGNRAETALALLGIAGIVASLFHADTFGGALTAGLLVLPTLAFASAPLNSLAAQRATLPPELAARRRTELRRGYYVRRGLSAIAGLGAAVAGVAIVLALLGPGGGDVRAPQLVGPKQSTHEQPTSTSPTEPTPSTGPTSATTSATTSAPTTAPTTSSTTTVPTTSSTTPTTTSPTTSPTASAPASAPTTSAPTSAAPSSAVPTPTGAAPSTP